MAVCLVLTLLPASVFGASGGTESDTHAWVTGDYDESSGVLTVTLEGQSAIQNVQQVYWMMEFDSTKLIPVKLKANGTIQTVFTLTNGAATQIKGAFDVDEENILGLKSTEKAFTDAEGKRSVANLCGNAVGECLPIPERTRLGTITFLVIGKNGETDGSGEKYTGAELQEHFDRNTIVIPTEGTELMDQVNIARNYAAIAFLDGWTEAQRAACYGKQVKFNPAMLTYYEMLNAPTVSYPGSANGPAEERTPSAPTGVTATVTGATKAALSWTAPQLMTGVPAVTGYKITGTNGYAGITAGKDATSVELTGLQKGQKYTFSILAANSNGEGAAAASNEAVTWDVPGAPSSVSGSKTDKENTLKFSWTAPSSSGGTAVTGYELTVKDKSDGSKVVATDPNLGAGTVEKEVGSLTDGHEYVAEVKAKNAVGTGTAAVSAPVTLKNLYVPGAPASVAGSKTDVENTLKFTWTAPASDGGSAITGYILTVKDKSDGDKAAATEPNLSAGTLEKSVGGLTDGHSYVAEVKAKNAVGTGTAAVSAPITLKNLYAPDAPASVTGTMTDVNGKLKFAWTAPASDGGSAVTGYELTVKDKTDGNKVVATETNLSAATLEKEITGLTDKHEYTAEVKAKNAVGTGIGKVSAPVAVKNLYVPDAPASVTGARTDKENTLKFTWTAPASDGGSAVTGYELTVKDKSDSDKVVSTESDLSASMLEKEVSGLTDGHEYIAEVKAKNTVGTGAATVSEPVAVENFKGVTVTGSVALTAGDAGKVTAVLTKTKIADASAAYAFDADESKDLIAVVTVDSDDPTQAGYVFEGVEPGTYTLLIRKPGALYYLDSAFTVEGAAAAETVTLSVGDLDRNGVINALDLNTLVSSDTFGKLPSAAAYPWADLDGNDIINALDLNALVSNENFGKSAVMIHQ